MSLLDDTSFHALCYSSCTMVSAYIMGVVSRIIITATEGLEEEKKQEELEEIAAVVMESLTVHDQVEGEDRSRKALKVKCVCVCVCVRGFVCVCFVSVCICVSLCVCSVASYKSTCACR